MLRGQNKPLNERGQNGEKVTKSAFESGIFKTISGNLQALHFKMEALCW